GESSLSAGTVERDHCQKVGRDLEDSEKLTKRARGASPTRKSIMRRLVHRKTKAIRARLVGPTTARYTRTQERPGSGARRMIQANAPKPTASTIAVNNITHRRRRAHSERKASIDSGARGTDSSFPGRILT